MEVLGGNYVTWVLKHRSSGEEYDAYFSRLERGDLKNIAKGTGWTVGFNWGHYLRRDSDYIAYKLHIAGNDGIQGIVAIALREGYVEIDLAEKSPNNRRPRNQFSNAGDLLFAFACKVSLENDGEGYVMLKAKSGLVQHYQRKYKMELINPRERTMAIVPVVAKKMVELYYR
ncbi:hypothetical protein H7B90_30325 [Cohnella xylanilytica]|uniref:Uncharacterized protein n=1 Tax=Cohnella xylanilytica TaxID=557555 RepID=A0A841U9N4_9BACL|nr:hypothetical protein [Cohnella xylanilytica]MBB6695698.1 hypothetical protein [Cohnella xylanilytica]